MVGYIHFTNQFGCVKIVRHRLYGLTLCELRLPGAAGSIMARRRLFRGLEGLSRMGCGRLLNPSPLCPEWEGVHTRALWQSVAARLALSALERRKIEPNQAVVGIRADRLSRNLLRCCCSLAPRVRALALSPTAERLLGWELERRFGLPATEGRADVELSFLSGDGGENRYCIGDLDPEITDFTLKLPGLVPPEGCPTLPLLSALLEEGRIPAADLVLIST